MLRKVDETALLTGERAGVFLTDKLKSKIAVLNRALNKDDSKTACSKREDHPEWFEGLDTNSPTKEAYMHRRCQDRIRGYLYKTIEQIRSSEAYINDREARKNLQLVIVFFKMQLRKDHYFGHYFDRSCFAEAKAATDKSSDDETDSVDKCPYEHCPCRMSISSYERYILGLSDDEVDAKKLKRSDTSDKKSGNRSSEQEKQELQEAEEKCPYEPVARVPEDRTAICDATGEFRCRGVWNRDQCSYGDKHKINPYRSKEELVLFSTWNLDHRIERSRTLVPELLDAAKRNKIDPKNVLEFYNNLFTIQNLRLVHIVCHDKGSHK